MAWWDWRTGGSGTLGWKPTTPGFRHELEHVDTITRVITDLGGEPVAEATYDVGYTE
jgi:hypothetical protein